MKKLILSLSLAGAALICNAQSSLPWTTDLNSGSGFRLGLSTPDDLKFFTNGLPVMSLSSHGDVQLTNLADATATDNRLLYIDANGNLKISPFPPQGVHGPCQHNVLPWYEGGNQTSAYNDIGTCDDRDFILKANNVRSLFVKSTSGMVGIGPNNSNPQAALDVADGSYGSTLYHTLITGDVYGRILTIGTEMSMVSASNFYVHTGGLFTPGSSERFAVMTNGNVGVGTYNPGYKLQVIDPSSAHINAYTTSTSKAKVSVSNSYLMHYISTDNAIGHLGASFGSPLVDHDILNFGTAVSTNSPQVWIGSKKPQSPHADFSFAVQGKIVAQSLYITAAGSPNWADYVFADDYRLPKLTEVEKFYKENRHLPEIPTTKEVSESGIDVAGMNALLLKKVEELTLYMVEQQKITDALKNEVDLLKSKVK